MSINDYEIQINEDTDSNKLSINIHKEEWNCYEAKFELENLQKMEEFREKKSIKEIIDSLLTLINKKQIEFKIFNKNIKIIFLNKEELVINRKYNFSENVIKLLIDKNEYLSKQNKELKNQLKIGNIQNIFDMQTELKS